MSMDTTTNPGESGARRLEQVYGQLATLLGRPDGVRRLGNNPDEDEWSAMQVLAHMSETIPYWMGNVGKIVAAGEDVPAHFGRSLDAPQRHAGINRSESEDVETLLALLGNEVRAAAGGLRQMSAADYQRTGLYHGEEVMGVAHVVEVYILSHAEAHLAQITAAV